jgi:hypothetical protein
MLNTSQKRDLELIHDTSKWPGNLLMFVLRQIGKEIRCGFLIKGGGSKLYEANAFDLTSKSQFKEIPVIEFKSFVRGWVGG